MNRIGFGKNSFALKATGFTNKANSDGAILALFTGGKQGLIYDPSDLTSLWQDASGTVPVTKSGDPVGLILDKSGNGNHAVQTVSASRPTYQTDGVLSWLQGDGVDDYLDTGIVAWNGSAFFQSSAIRMMGGEIYSGPFRILREGGNPVGTSDNYFEEYSGTNESTLKMLVQRYPRATVFYQGHVRPPLGGDHISWQSNGASVKTQVLPNQTNVVDAGFQTLPSGNATLSLFRGYSGHVMRGRMYGFIWLSATPTDAERNNANAYLAIKSGVTL